MESPPYRRTEQVCIALYALLAVGSALVVEGASGQLPASGAEPAPAPGVAVGFLAVGLFWLCVVAAAATAVVVAAVNIRRRWTGYEPDAVTEGAALTVLGCLAAAAVSGLGFASIPLALTFAFVALVLAPAALLVATFGDRYRQ